jgi:hypothetical protein
MGTHRTVTWFALFALIANAGSGLGLELVRPTGEAQVMTVCETQSAIATMLTPSKPASGTPDICSFQLALDFACDTEDSATNLDPSPLFGAVFHDPTPAFDTLASAANFALRSLLDRPEVTVNTRSFLDFALPLGSPPAEQSLHALLTPNGPPTLA